MSQVCLRDFSGYVWRLKRATCASVRFSPAFPCPATERPAGFLNPCKAALFLRTQGRVGEQGTPAFDAFVVDPCGLVLG